MDNIINMENATIRVDTATQKASVIDVVKMVLQCNPSAAYSYYSRLLQENSENEVGTGVGTDNSNLSQLCEKIRIDGKGKLTPVADAKTLVEIVFLLPGKMARDFRRKSAAKVCRLLGGDMTLVSEIEERRTLLESTEEGRATQAFLLGGTSSESSHKTEIDAYNDMAAGFRFLDTSERQVVAKEVVQQALEQQRQEIEREKQALKRQKFDDLFVRYKSLVDIGVELDDRTKIEMRDNVSISTKRDIAGEKKQEPGTELCAIPDATTPTHTLGAGQRGDETGIVVVANKMGVRVPTSMSGPVGKLMKALYKKKYNLPADWNDFPKRQTLYHGRPIHENNYFERDEDIIEEAIRAEMKLSQ